MIEMVNCKQQDALFYSRVRRPKNVHNVELLLEAPKQFKTPGRTKAQRNGKNYENRFLRYLATQFELVLAGPWFRYADHRSAGRLCQPDALVLSDGGKRVSILEVKRIHHLDAWFQLRKLYTPVVQALWPEAKISVCEVTMAFDAAKPWPEPVGFCTEITDILNLGSTFGVYQWRK